MSNNYVKTRSRCWELL